MQWNGGPLNPLEIPHRDIPITLRCPSKVRSCFSHLLPKADMPMMGFRNIRWALVLAARLSL
ncbi:hypothetical protein BHK69_18705 [Bosea vaviloviae]|uniref:Uncharacterized protein n=1 Tax=Bosea vaviloviae TaxID=1526658 RepID=A0A1D7U4A6_9HYPH|nr:hypothetical protein BHK69_18705 [Bosea vaviloviae]